MHYQAEYRMEPLGFLIRDGRQHDALRFSCQFRLVPSEKVGEPDELKHTATRTVVVTVSGDVHDLDLEAHDNDGLLQRVLFWYAKAAIERNHSKDAIELTLTTDTFDRTLDYSKVKLPNGPFPLVLPGPVFGFRPHAAL